MIPRELNALYLDAPFYWPMTGLSMRPIRFIALILICAALACGVYDLVDGRFHALGEIWYMLAPGSLNLAQAVTQRYLLPELWDPVIVWILQWPAGAIFSLVGLVVLILTNSAHERLQRDS